MPAREKGKGKRVRERIPKADRKSKRLWAEGSRESILNPHLEGYTQALSQGWVAERKYWKKVCNEYHARVDWRTPDENEPVLCEWGPDHALPTETLTPEEEVEKRQRVKLLNMRIRRWFKYRAKRIRKSSSGTDPTKDPYAMLLAQLSKTTTPPKARQAFQQYMHECYETDIADRVTEQWAAGASDRAAAGDSSKVAKAGFRAQVARDAFAKLPLSDQEVYGLRAKQAAAHAREVYMERLKAPPSQRPQDRQSCIDSLSDFMAPILQGIHAHTGCHATIIIGGPMPKFGGELRTLHVSYGRNKTAAASHWAQWDKTRFANDVSGFMIEYLKTAYSKEDCAKAALPVDDAGSRAVGTEDDDSEPDSAFPEDDEDDTDDQGDDEEEHEAGRMRKKKKVTLSNKGKGVSAATVGDGEQDEHQDEQQEQEARQDDEQEDEQEPQEVLWDDDPMEAVRKIEALKRVAQRKINALSGSSDAANRIDEINRQLQDDIHARNRANENRRQQRIARNREAMAELQRSMAEVFDTPQNPPVPPRARAPRRETVPAGGNESAPRRSARHAAGAPVSGSTLPSGPGIAGSGTNAPATIAAMPMPTASAPPTASIDHTTETDPLQALLPSSASIVPARSLSIVSAADPVPCPASAPPWFVDARRDLEKTRLGPHFDAVLAAWTRIEDASRFEHGPTNLPSKFRPKQVTTWISNGRGKRGETPTVSDPQQYGVEWRMWWGSLQPEWREKDADGSWSVARGYGGGGREWGPLYQWGVNGVLSVVASLYFWGCSVPETGRAEWEAAVNDVAWMFEGMATYYELFGKRF